MCVCVCVCVCVDNKIGSIGVEANRLGWSRR